MAGKRSLSRIAIERILAVAKANILQRKSQLRDMVTMEVIQFLQQFDFPVIVMAMKAITFLGDEAFYLLILPVVFWCWKKDIGLPMIILLYVTFLLNTGLKEWFAIPRPPEEMHMVKVVNYGFPSGHAQSAMVLWGYFAWRFRSYGWTVPLIFFIGFSRVYLGVHSLQDIVGGWSIGFASLLAGISIIKALEKKPVKLPPIPLVLVFGFVGGIIPVLYPDVMVVKISGFMVGIGAGLVLEKDYIGFRPQAVWWKQVLKILIGVSGAIALRAGLKIVFPEMALMDWLRYGITGLWVGFGALWIFRRLGN